MRHACRMRFSLVTSPLMGLVMLSLVAACADERDANASAPAATSPEAAIGALVESQGQRYAGLCERTRSPEDIDKVCSKLIETRAGVQAHLIGRTFSEFDTWVFVTQRDGTYTVVSTVKLDFFDTSGMIPWPS
jgi:hypothetical protein